MNVSAATMMTFAVVNELFCYAPRYIVHQPFLFLLCYIQKYLYSVIVKLDYLLYLVCAVSSLGPLQTESMRLAIVEV